MNKWIELQQLTEEEIREFEETYDRKMTGDEVVYETVDKNSGEMLHLLFDLQAYLEHYKNNICEDKNEKMFGGLLRKINKVINILAMR